MKGTTRLYEGLHATPECFATPSWSASEDNDASAARLSSPLRNQSKHGERDRLSFLTEQPIALCKSVLSLQGAAFIYFYEVCTAHRLAHVYVCFTRSLVSAFTLV